MGKVLMSAEKFGKLCYAEKLAYELCMPGGMPLGVAHFFHDEPAHLSAEAISELPGVYVVSVLSPLGALALELYGPFVPYVEGASVWDMDEAMLASA